MFDRMLRAGLLDPKNGPEWDLPTPRGPVRTYVVASTPRTGSTLLCRSLWDTGLAGAPKEYLNPMQLRDWEVRLGTPASALRHRLLSGRGLALIGRRRWDEARLDAHLQRVQARRSSGGWFGLKLHAHHHRQWFAVRELEQPLGPLRWVRIVREDRLAQAISWDKALQTGRWATEQRVRERVAAYSRRAITERLRAIERDEAWWADQLAGEQVCVLTYERVRNTRAQAVREVLAHLGVDGAESVGVHAAPLGRQADATSAEWAARYRAGR